MKAALGCTWLQTSGWVPFQSLSLILIGSVGCLTFLLLAMADVQDSKPNHISTFQTSAISHLPTFHQQIQVLLTNPMSSGQ